MQTILYIPAKKQQQKNPPKNKKMRTRIHIHSNAYIRIYKNVVHFTHTEYVLKHQIRLEYSRSRSMETFLVKHNKQSLWSWTFLLIKHL